MNCIRLTTILMAAMLSVSLAQAPLPDAAREALAEAEATMREALATYEAHYPDRELWQLTFQHVRRARSLAPDHPEPQRLLAEAYSRANWYGPAWQAWLDYLDGGNLLDADDTPLFTEVGSRTGYNLYSQGRLDAAAEVYRRIIDEVPFDLDAHVWMGRIHMEQGRPEAAISYWQTVTERNPQDQRARYFLELAREQADYGVEAVTAFREGVSFFEQGEFERARERFARATALNADYPDAWAWLGRVAFDQGDYADARTYYGRASRLEPDNETYRYFLEEASRRLEPDQDGGQQGSGAGAAQLPVNAPDAAGEGGRPSTVRGEGTDGRD